MSGKTLSLKPSISISAMAGLILVDRPMCAEYILLNKSETRKCDGFG